MKYSFSKFGYKTLEGLLNRATNGTKNPIFRICIGCSNNFFIGYILRDLLILQPLYGVEFNIEILLYILQNSDKELQYS